MIFVVRGNAELEGNTFRDEEMVKYKNETSIKSNYLHKDWRIRKFG